MSQKPTDELRANPSNEDLTTVPQSSGEGDTLVKSGKVLVSPSYIPSVLSLIIAC